MKKENISAILIALIVLIVVNLPMLYFSLFHQANLIFLGRRFINPEDTYPYVSLIEQARQGKILFENLYTSEVQAPSLFMPSYLFIGRVASFLNLSSIAAYHGARIIFSIIFFFVVYKFLSKFFEEPKKRLLAFVIILTSSGFGFFLNKITPSSTDLWMPESNTFLTLADAPHFILSQVLMLSGFYLFLGFIEKKKIIYIAGSSLLFLLLSFEYPFAILVVAPTIIFTCLLMGLPILESISLLLINSFGIVNLAIEAYKNGFTKFWGLQSVLQPPSPSSYLVGYGLLIVFALFGIEEFLKKNRAAEKLVIIWIFSCAVPLYSPFAFRGRIVDGLHLPISILATCGLLSVASLIKKSWSKTLIVASLIILPLSSLYSVVRDFENLAKGPDQIHYSYISKPELEALNWLKEQTNSRDIILSNWYFGNLIPGLIGRKVYLGHETWTISFEQKVQATNTFLLNPNVFAAEGFLTQNGITYIFLGINDPIITYGFQPGLEPFLERSYFKNGVSIYKVVPYFVKPSI